ncbi:hypothetical protein FRC15_001607, partial [Serendipita sp. 397]
SSFWSSRVRIRMAAGLSIVRHTITDDDEIEGSSPPRMSVHGIPQVHSGAVEEQRRRRRRGFVVEVAVEAAVAAEATSDGS